MFLYCLTESNAKVAGLIIIILCDADDDGDNNT